MMSHETWTHGTCDLIETLTCRVRVLSLSHIQRGWREQFGSLRVVLETVERLVKADLLQGDVWSLPATPVNGKPLCCWSPGEAEPEFIRLERTVYNRWGGPTTAVPVVASTHKAARLFGSTTGGLPPENHRNHDLICQKSTCDIALNSRCSRLGGSARMPLNWPSEATRTRTHFCSTNAGVSFASSNRQVGIR